jgi:short subunit fatty acids transporter
MEPNALFRESIFTLFTIINPLVATLISWGFTLVKKARLSRGKSVALRGFHFCTLRHAQALVSEFSESSSAVTSNG